jgi:hypothetical protein
VKGRIFLLVLMGAFLAGTLTACPAASEVGRRGKKRMSKKDKREFAGAADAALRRAIAFEEEFPYDIDDQITKYQYVIDNYPHARTACAAAQWRIDRCKQDRGYRGGR